MHIVAFGTYQADTHPRVRVLIEGLRAHGHEVVEINQPLGLTTAQRVSMLRRPWTVPILVFTVLKKWSRLWRLARVENRRGRPDAVLVGYLAHFDVHLARWLFPDSPIALDHLIFAAGTALDRGAKPGLLTRALNVVDRRALSAADVIVLDTDEHAARVPPALSHRNVVAQVGADSEWFAAGEHAVADPGRADPVRVIFYGLYTPLQGAVVIGAALAQLADKGFAADRVLFTMIGSGQDLESAREAAGPDAPVCWLDWVAPGELPSVVAGHHVALGIFGTTPKAWNVVPHKVFQSAAAGCAVVTSDTAPQRRALGDSAILVPPGDVSALTSALAALIEDREMLTARREDARRHAAEEFAGRAVVSELAAKLRSVSLAKTRRRPAGPVAPLTPRAALRWPLIRRAMRETRPANTLEIGCGQGAMGARIVALTPSFTAVEPDLSSFDIARARIEMRGGEVLNCTSEELPDGQFDMVCAFEVLEHLEDDAGALASWAPKVRLGGHLLLSVPAWQHMFGPWDKAVGHYRRYSPDELADKLRAAGFEPVDVGLYGWPLAFALEAIRNRVADGSARIEDSPSEQTAHSGRWLQPTKRLSDVVITAGILPFQVLQRLAPGKGNGIVSLARRVR